MKIIQCILVLFLIKENKAIIGDHIVHDVLQIKPLMDDLEDIFDNDGALNEYFTCSELNFINCYKKLLELYENDIQYQIVNVIGEYAVKILGTYNDLVLRLFDTIFPHNEHLDNNFEQYPKEAAEITTKIIRFDNSNVNCVIDFLMMYEYNTYINYMLSDYIFFDHNETLQTQNMITLKSIIDSHFKDRNLNLRNLDLNMSKIDLSVNIIPEHRKKILKFSTPFCNINGIPLLKRDLWLWKKLKNSFLLAQKMHHSKSLMDWQDLKVFYTISTYIILIINS